MRLLVQRVTQAELHIDGERHASIGPGLVVLLGIHRDDKENPINWLVNKLVNLRIFCDEEGKMNRSVTDIGGEILLVSQFTLYADCNAGRRPDLFHAANGPMAQRLYESFVTALQKQFPRLQTGVFGAYMQITLCNDGPVTMLIDKE